MIMSLNEIRFSLECCNEYLRGYAKRIEDGELKKDNILMLESKLKKHYDTMKDTQHIEISIEERTLLKNIIELTVEELEWELPIRTSFSKTKAEVMLSTLNLNM